MCLLVTTEALDKLLAPLPDVMGPQDVADLLGLPRRSVTRWLQQGTLPGFQVGGDRGSWRILKPELRAYLMRHRNQEPDGTPRPVED